MDDIEIRHRQEKIGLKEKITIETVAATTSPFVSIWKQAENRRDGRRGFTASFREGGRRSASRKPRRRGGSASRPPRERLYRFSFHFAGRIRWRNFIGRPPRQNRIIEFTRLREKRGTRHVEEVRQRFQNQRANFASTITEYNANSSLMQA